MSKMPKWMANAMESMLKSFYFECKIIAIAYWNEELLKITFEALTLMPNCKLGDAVSIRVSATEFRNYTPVAIKDQPNCFYIIFHLHAGTLGNDYIQNIKLDDVLKMVIPRGRLALQGQADNHVVVTDETGLGFALNMVEENHSLEQPCYVITENHAKNTPIITNLFKPAITVRKGQIEQGLNLFFKNYFHRPLNTHFYLIGNARTIQQTMSLLKKQGVLTKNIYAQPFWALGKKGL